MNDEYGPAYVNDEYALAYAILQQLTRIADALEELVENERERDFTADNGTGD